MIKIKDKYKVRFGDGQEFTPADNIGLAGGTDGAFTIACQLVGPEKFFLDIIDRPDFAKKLMNIIIEKEISWNEFVKKEMSLPKEGVSMTDDFAPYLSTELYEEFALPYEKRFREHFGGYCTFHFCILAKQLLKHLLNDLKINCYYGFKPNAPIAEHVPEMKEVLEIMGNKIHIALDIDAAKNMMMSYDELYNAMIPVVKGLSKYNGIQLLGSCSESVTGDKIKDLAAITKASKDFS
jgi:hypothetical protein